VGLEWALTSDMFAERNEKWEESFIKAFLLVQNRLYTMYSLSHESDVLNMPEYVQDTAQDGGESSEEEVDEAAYESDEEQARLIRKPSA
jgi:hypothetical protein